MVDDWEIRLSDQLKRMKSSSLYDESNEIIVDEGIIQVVPAWQWLLNI